MDLFTDPDIRAAMLPAVLAALVIGQLGASLSVLVVLRRLAFIGQGISHAAFGGVGLGALLVTLGALGSAEPWGPASQVVTFVLVVIVALLSAWAIASMRGARTSGDTAIGIVLAVAMAVGFVLHGVAVRRAPIAGMTPPPAIETVLFGSILATGWAEAMLAIGASVLVWALLFWHRRAIVFWAFDETGARSFGVRTGVAGGVCLALLAVAVVVTMSLVGVVLATAFLVLPGAIALRLSRRWASVLLIAHGAALAGVVLGLCLALFVPLPLAGDGVTWPPGPAIVLALCGLYLLALVVTRLGTSGATGAQSPAPRA